MLFALEFISFWTADVRHWAEVSCCTITTYMSDLEVNVRDIEKIMLNMLNMFYAQQFPKTHNWKYMMYMYVLWDKRVI